ncbi:hypothetical protein BDN72DRAFT_878828 [Pluteus cervinus]|uniref:Uncharacterized protein n=1 Tax=Pluteus cervinus TaxID=181527 RepID=A0ACD3ATA6_9AGAR|nr:hypothetical protein BDN72DRAFT_878828 [Pluteus cervinus]
MKAAFFPSRSSNTTATEEDRELLRQHDSLKRQDTYTGNAGVCNAVEWVSTAFGHKLVLKAETNKSEADSVVLSVVVKISQSFLDAGLFRSSEFTPELKDMRLSAMGIVPGITLFDDEFLLARKNIEKMLMGVETKGKHHPSWPLKDRSGDSCIKFRHRVFTERVDRPSDEEVTNQNERWDPRSDDAVDEWTETIQKYHPQEIRAYDKNGDLVKPTQYNATFRGAVVRMNFNLTHWRTVQTVTISIVAMRVLVPPSSQRLPEVKDPFDVAMDQLASRMNANKV